MSFSTEALIGKLETLSATQNSITSTSQWVLFYKRHADVIVKQWAEYVESHPKKNLALLYLANEVVQQSKARARAKAKDIDGSTAVKVNYAGFVEEFGKVLPGVVNEVYFSSSPENKERIKRLVNVWKERSIFSDPVKLKDANQVEDAPAVSKQPVKSEVNVQGKESISVEGIVGKFQRWYHEVLASQDKKELDTLRQVLKESIEGLEELQTDIDRESYSSEKRQEKADQQRKRTLDLLKQRQDEDILPTYDASSDSESESGDNIQDKDVDSDDSDKDVKPKKKLRFADE